MLNTNHPAVALVLLVGLTIIALVPLVAWVTLGSGRDKKANLWFLGMLFYVLNVALFALQFTLPAWLATLCRCPCNSKGRNGVGRSV